MTTPAPAAQYNKRSLDTNWLYTSDIVSGVTGGLLKAIFYDSQRSGKEFLMNTGMFGLNSMLSRWITYSDNEVSRRWKTFADIFNRAEMDNSEYVTSLAVAMGWNVAKGKSAFSPSVLMYPVATLIGDQLTTNVNSEYALKWPKTDVATDKSTGDQKS